MSQRKKLLERLKSKPKDFTWEELTNLLASLGYQEKTNSGSRRKFVKADGVSINLHKPHPGNVIKAYVVTEVLDHLRQEGLL